MPSPRIANSSDCLTSVARGLGFESWEALYNHPANQELKQKRPNPNQLTAGDPIALPELTYDLAERGVDSWYDFIVNPEVANLRMRLLDAKGTPLANQAYVLLLGGQERSGTTDGDGILTEPVVVGLTQATLTTKLPAGDEEQEQSYHLLFGRLDPITTISGIQARLANLGYYAGSIDGVFSDETSQALAAFQVWAGLPASGFHDAETLDALEQRHDQP